MQLTGSWIIPGQTGLAAALEKASAELGLDVTSAAAAPDVPRHESKLPRLAVWHSWADTQAVGWIRLVLDREKVPYAYVRDEDIRSGRLREKYDVIVFGDNWLNLQDQIHGIDRKWGPLAYQKTKETPNLGVPDASADITGGIGWLGVAKIEEFLNAGGVLVTLGNGSRLALEEAKWYNTLGDIVGIFDPTGLVDLINGISYWRQGDKLFAILSWISVLPVLGDLIAKPVVGSMKIGGDAIKAFRTASAVGDAAKIAETAKAAGGPVAKLVSSTPKWGATLLGKLGKSGKASSTMMKGVTDYVKVFDDGVN